MPDLGFVAESVTTALTGLLVSDAYTSLRPRLSAILSRSRNNEGASIEDLDRLREVDPARLHSAVHEYVQRLAASDGRLVQQLRDVLGEPEPRIQLNVHDNQFRGPTQVGGIQIVNMHEVEHEPEL
ncbi:hypothetical protein [Streptomyces acidiscabies]|uniref:Uncharacterized protein n=1 Tax=Streptomyces acidiscabies TaxID=42234 RepID=A0AAP6BIJ6_9ACTN|nr:hypothetical protein [Streptomyces acidiscabies]MBP5938594.1 hypothetical protein [Streptomyces sp. LBUM 1476]MBZ3909690.1 hypothetical protein [Streptomyces acidiscabies]MDX2965348.1 hypothetical protein [Streptomyces acidiscabies]MDX3024583.1 hypothetical protein [Streptomyces acidiscabies]MDX3795182.1 hypothetical protein [Streptomyces acidiscabies]